MATGRQIKANRANARASTGPRTPGGKRRSARNAERHGLTGAPGRDQILAWYRTILDDPGATLPIAGLDARTAAALRLAEAEADLAAVRAAAVKALAALQPEAPAQKQPPMPKFDPKDPSWSLQLATEYILRRQREAMERFKHQERDITKDPGDNRLRLFTRYRASAEARRLTALRGWIRALEGRAE